MDNLLVTSTSPGVRGFTGETNKGGPGNNMGSTVVTTHNHAPIVSAGPDHTHPAAHAVQAEGHRRPTRTWTR